MTDFSETTNALLQGDRRAIAKTITLIESHKSEDKQKLQDILKNLPEQQQKSLTVGITGSPGVGKSTFLDSLVTGMRETDQIAILAIDPSSAVSGGSILGDKTRMPKITSLPNVFIRPSPAGSSLGGVASTTFETTLFFKKIGFDYIFIETVGVGQSEYYVKQLSDVLLLLLQPGSGDDLQAMKKGIMETADAYIVTKSDGTLQELASKSASEISHYVQNKPVLTVSASENRGLEEVKEMLQDLLSNGDFVKKRLDQKSFWLFQSLSQTLEDFWMQDEENKTFIYNLTSQLKEDKIDYLSAQSQLRNLIQNKYDL